MKPSTTVRSVFAALCAALFLAVQGNALGADSPQYFELRVYATKSADQQKLINDYWHDAAVPAYNRMGVSPIGVFTELEDSPSNHVYVLIPFNSPEAYASVPEKLANDADYQKAASEYLNTPKNAPAYIRFESSLLVAFDGMKQIAVPPSAAEKTPWVFELRMYQSHSEGKGNNKVKMFNSGEIPLMKKVDLSPVFFGQMLVGSEMPNLVYMVSSENKEAHAVHWKAFFDDPIWKKLSADPQYKDNVSKVISTFLKRTSASQI